MIAIFYADDGRLAGFSTIAIQNGLNIFQDLFSRVGLFFNATKTKTIISTCVSPFRTMSNTAYKRRFDHSLPTFR
jgi:hypothetical protein